MIEYILESLAPLKVPKIIITNSAYDYRQFPSLCPCDCRSGALNGIYTAPHHSKTPYALCVACDMPFLNTDALQYLLALRDQADAVAARIDEIWQTFPAVYYTRLLPSLRETIDKHHLQMQRILNQMAIYIDTHHSDY